MARPPKESIDYAGWDVNVFDGDAKIDKLIDAQGLIGFGIYFYLCLRAYGTNGYYYEWSYDDAPTTARKIGGGVGSQNVINTVGLCLRVGLFDNDLFVGHGILTSRGIQKRFWHVTKSRSGNRTIQEKYWLLSGTGSEGLFPHTKKTNFTTPKPGFEAAKPGYEPLKESKVKDRKGEESDADAARPARERSVAKYYLQHIQQNAHTKLIEKLCTWTSIFPDDVIIKAIDESIENGKRNFKYIESILRNWDKEKLYTLSKVEGHLKEWSERKGASGNHPAALRHPSNGGEHPAASAAPLQRRGSSNKSRFASSNKRDWDYNELMHLATEYANNKGGI